MPARAATALAAALAAAAPVQPTTPAPQIILPQDLSAAPQPPSPYICPGVKTNIDAVQTAVQSAATEALRVMKLNPQPSTDKKLCAAELSVRGAVTKARALPRGACFATKTAYDRFQSNLATIADGAEKVIAAYKCGH